MGLKAKFNLVMLAAFVVGLALAAVLSWRIVNQNARREVVQQAAVMMAMASAIRDYTDHEARLEIGDELRGRIATQDDERLGKPRGAHTGIVRSRPGPDRFR